MVDAHGYLTRSEHYLKDTVGEDMELVVRLTRGLREARVPFAVQYAARANCWTEIPESFRVLNRQRDRWQRGLLDIVTFHFAMMANPRYGRAGLVAFPYFLLYEVLGPWFEAEGYLVFATSLALGMIGLPMLRADARGDRAARARGLARRVRDHRAPARVLPRAATGSCSCCSRSRRTSASDS